MTSGRSLLLFEEDCGGLDEGGDSDEYGSESDGMVSWELESSGGEGDCSRSSREVMVNVVPGQESYGIRGVVRDDTGMWLSI
jgi:hypothetical protein